MTERVLGSVGLAPSDGKGYEVYLETRCLELGLKAGRQELEAAWKSLRRGWYVGREGFREGLLEKAKGLLLGKTRTRQAGEVGKAHGQAQAERILTLGLRRLGLERKKLATGPKGQMEKQILAWWLHGQTTVPRRWITENLKMGYETRVSQAVSWVESSRLRVVVELKKKLAAER